MRWCPRCDNCRWVCEIIRTSIPRGIHGCTCGGAGVPCPFCNKSDDESSAPALPKGFVSRDDEASLNAKKARRPIKDRWAFSFW